MSGEPVEVRAPPEPVGWQAQKSAATRAVIVDAAIRCIIELGYARTTTTAIAKRASVSRGAMLHHFPAKIDIVRAAVDFLHAKRLKAFQRAVGRLAPGAGDRVQQAVEAFWAQLRHPMFVAFFELSVAARTDAELAALLLPAQESFDREWYQTAREVFPGGADRGEEFDTAVGLSRYAMEGMAVSYLMQKAPERTTPLLRSVEARLRAVLGGGRS